MTDMDENDITMTEAEKHALDFMEHESGQNSDGADADSRGDCADESAMLMLIQNAMLVEANPDGIDAGAELRRFHASHRKPHVWRIGLMTAAAIALLLIAIVPTVVKDSHQAEETALVDDNMLYKAIAEESESETDYILSKETAHWNVETTRYGCTRAVVLPDGTEVMLSSNSRLSYPSRFTGATRIVTLKGEAYFSVAKDRQHPFIVRSGDIITKVIGTQFCVRNYTKEQLQVILVEGKVALSDVNGKRHIEMSPGQSAVWNGDDEFTVADNVDTQSALSWKDGYLYFDDVTFGDMMREIGRWYNVDVTTVPSAATDAAMLTRVHFYISVSQQLQNAIDMINKQDIAAVSITKAGIVVSGK